MPLDPLLTLVDLSGKVVFMPDVKKGIARIEVPTGSRPGKGVSAPEQEPAAVAPEERGVHALVSQPAVAKRDPLIVPLAGLVLAFSVVGLIVQLLIAFG
jgi:hypothetical protein